MNLLKEIRGKTEQQIADLVQNAEPADVAHLLFTLSNFEPHFSAQTVARMRDLHVQTVIKLIKDGRIRRVHRTLDNNGYRIPLSSVLEWDNATAISRT